MQCKELEAVLEQEELSSLPPDAQRHLAGCTACQEMLADLTAIVDAARQIPAEAQPPQRVWVSLRAQLEAEGIIREPEFVEHPERVAWWSSFSSLWRPRVLAAAATALFVVVGAAYLQQRNSVDRPAANRAPAQPQVKQPVKESLTATAPAAAESTSKAPQVNAPVETETARVNAPTAVQPPEPRESNTALRSSPSEDANFGIPVATMNQMEDAVPTRRLADNEEVDSSFRDNLRTLNGFIAECEARLKKNPKDRLTREYLNMALQQKAELLTAMMDSGRSEN